LQHAYNDDPITHHGGAEHKEEKCPVIPSSNTVPHPWTMMIEFVDTVITYSTMRASRRPVMVTGRAKLGCHDVSIDMVIS